MSGSTPIPFPQQPGERETAIDLYAVAASDEEAESAMGAVDRVFDLTHKKGLSDYAYGSKNANAL